jgi:putative phage-type endonuclease
MSKKNDSDDAFEVFDIKKYKVNDNKQETQQNKIKIIKSDKKENNNGSDDIFDVFGIKNPKKIKDEGTSEKEKKEKKEPKAEFKEKEKEKKELKTEFKENKNSNKNSNKKQHQMICSGSSKTYNITCPSEPKLYPFGTTWVHDSDDQDDELSSEQKEIKKRVEKLLKIEYPAQRTKAWFEMRRSCISASSAGTVINENQHSPPYTFILEKCLEPKFEYGAATYHGTKLEQIATMVYEYRMNVKVEEFGLVKHPTIPFLGASPDGIIGKYKLNGKNRTKYIGRMLEIKCPRSRQINDNDPFDHIKYYWVQVQLQLECCNLEECMFWQNIIKEYSSREEFIEDTDENEPFRSKSFGMEKGCLIELIPKASMGELKDRYNDIIWGESKFLYPPRIDMTPLECDIWIAQTVNNLEKTLVDDIIKKYENEKNNIIDAIKGAFFIIYYKDEIDQKVDSLVQWLINENKVKKSELNDDGKMKDDAKMKFRPKKIKEVIDYYENNYMQKLMEKDPKFIKFLALNELKTNNNLYNKYNNDVELVNKIIDPDLDPELHNSFKFIKNLSQIIRDLEFPKKYCFHRVYYWRVEKTHCELVKRDREWFKSKLPIFEKVWKSIEILRENSDKVEKLLAYINSLPTTQIEFGKEYKDNNLVMKFVDDLCKDKIK